MDDGAVSYSDQRISLIPSGMHTFDILQGVVIHGGPAPSTSPGGGINYYSGAKSYSKSVKVDVIFEAGKYYTFDYKKSHKGVFKGFNAMDTIVEVTDSKIINKTKKSMEKVKGIELNSNWAKAHPNALEGMYKNKIKKETKLSKYAKVELSFTGNRFRYMSPTFVNSPFVYEGTFFFNENMIILLTDSLKMGDKEKKTEDGVTFIYYKFFKGILIINSADGALNSLGSGEFYSDSLTDTTAEKETISENDSSSVSQDVPTMPVSLEGNYTDAKGKKKITFTGNRFHIVGPVFMFRYIFDGTFEPDTNMGTIKLNIDTVTTGKTRRKTNETAFLSYNLEEGILNITDVSSKTADLLSQMKGQYKIEK